MSDLQKSDITRMQITGRFSIREIAAAVGVPEFTVADWLLKTGALKRK
jgi:hypothetical protein